MGILPFKKSFILPVLVLLFFDFYPASSFASVDSLIGNAFNYFNKGDYAQALQELGKVLLLEPGNEQVKQYIRLAREKQAEVEVLGRQARVVRILDQHIASTPSPSEVRRTVANREFGGKPQAKRSKIKRAKKDAVVLNELARETSSCSGKSPRKAPHED